MNWWQQWLAEHKGARVVISRLDGAVEIHKGERPYGLDPDGGPWRGPTMAAWLDRIGRQWTLQDARAHLTFGVGGVVRGRDDDGTITDMELLETSVTRVSEADLHTLNRWWGSRT